MLSFIFFAFLAYLLFKLVFGFILPVYRTTKRVKKSFRDMHQKMQEQQAQGRQATPQAPRQTTKKATAGDYIDFEEVKD